MEIERIKNDINGNPRFVIHFLAFVTKEENNEAWELDRKGKIRNAIDYQYNLALKKAKKYGGSKFSNKQYGGGIVFHAYNREEILNIVYEIKGNEMFEDYNIETKHLYINPIKTFIKIRYIFNDSEICNLFLKHNENMGVIEQINGNIFVANNNDK